MSLEELKKLVETKKSPVTMVNRGVIPLSLLGIAFIVLKVMGHITWSWWWVLAPFWIPVCIAVVLLLIIIFFLGIIAAKIDNATIEEVKTEKSKAEEVEEKKPKKKSSKRTKKTKTEENGTVEAKNA